MTITEIQNNAKTKMEKTKDVLRSDLMAIRAGRANPQLLDRITVDYYGTPTPLKNCLLYTSTDRQNHQPPFSRGGYHRPGRHGDCLPRV